MKKAQPQMSEQVPQEETVTFPYTDTPIPQPFAGVIKNVGDRWEGLREHLLRTLPSPIVNNSSNVVGMEQLVAEAMLFKSNGFNLISDATKTKPLPQKLLGYVTDPPVNIVKAAFGKIKNNGRKIEWFKPSTYVESLRGFVDLERASHVDSMGGKLPLTNNLSALAGLTGMSAMAVAALLPDRKETAEETEQMATLARDNPVGYMGHRLGQAVNPLAWFDNKRQFSGLGMMATGTLSLFSAFRQVEGAVVGHQRYRRNVWHMIGGAITALSGTQLLFAINNQQGWSNYGTTQLARVATLPMSIIERFRVGIKGKEQGAAWYLAGQAMMVTKNATSSLIGGGHRVNGELIDHEEMREQAKKKASLHHKQHDTPVTTIRGNALHERALEAAAPEVSM